MGGQMDERRKWVQCFNQVSCIIYVVGCSDYDQKMREDSDDNKLDEALQIFRKIWRNRWLKHISCIVFLNKQDILLEKIIRGRPDEQIENYITRQK